MSSYGKNLILGPTKTGKTSLLGALHLAANLSLASTDGYRCRLDNTSDDMDNLIESVDEVFEKHGQLSITGTTQQSDYQFDFKVELNRNLVDTTIRFLYPYLVDECCNARFEVTDVRGSIFNDLYQQNPTANPDLPAFRKAASQANGLILCVNSADDSKAALQATKNAFSFFRREFKKQLPFQRMVILMARADRWASQISRDADQTEKEALEESSPWDRLKEIVPPAAFIELLEQATKSNTDLACGWASVFGFRKDGSPNYCAKSDNLATFNEYQKHNNLPKYQKSWRPFRILDPLVFLLTGNLGTLERMPSHARSYA